MASVIQLISTELIMDLQEIFKSFQNKMVRPGFSLPKNNPELQLDEKS